MMKRCMLVSLAAAGFLALPGFASAIEIGQKAPPLDIQEWVKGDAIELGGAEGKIILLEFWATW